MNETTDTAAGSQPAYGIKPPGYRLPPDLRMGPVRLQVANLERSLGYYQEVLGFRPSDQADGHVLLGAAEDEGSVIELQERRGATPVPPQGRLGLYHFAILLPDRAALGRLIQHLAELGVRAGASDHLVSEAIYLQDPDGLGIEVYADRDPSMWRHEQGQLVMTTRPLDIDDLIRAANGEAWTGMPPGTRIGHVHLHVGDLGRAARFYHEGVGFDKTVWNYPGALFLSAGGYHHHLGVNTWAAGAAPASDQDARLLEWEIVLPGPADAEAALRSLADHSFEVEATADGGTAVDPWGVRLRIRGGSAAG